MCRDVHPCPVRVGDETKQRPISTAQGVAYAGTSRARCLAIVRPAFVRRTTGRRQEMSRTTLASNPQVIYEGRAGVKASPGHHLLAAGDDGPEAGVKVERPAGRTTLTPARTVVGWNEWWSWPCIKWGSLDQSSIRVGSHDGRAAWAAQSERAAVPKEAMTCGERAPTRFEALIGGPGRPGSRPRPGGRSSKA